MSKIVGKKTYVVTRNSKTVKVQAVGRAKGRSSVLGVSNVKSASGKVVTEYHTVKKSSAKTISKISRNRRAAIKSLAKR